MAEDSKAEWGARLRFAVLHGITPEAFWRLSLREWRMLTRIPEQDALPRDAFDTLMQQFPDGET